MSHFINLRNGRSLNENQGKTFHGIDRGDDKLEFHGQVKK
jgi:hypothetical protein